MRITKKTIFLIIFSSLIFPLLLFAQVLNGSFEIDGQPTLENWSFSCDLLASSSNDAPPLPDNNWCLKLESGNSQGCFPSYAYQIIPDVRNGDIWKATVLTKRENSWTQPSLYWKIFRANGDETDLPVATTLSYYWEQISIEDTIYISEGDSVAIILDAGFTGGPAVNHLFFDIVDVEKIGEVDSSPDETLAIASDNFELFQNYPNPFNPTTTINYQIKKSGKVELNIYNIKGQKVKTLVNKQEAIGLYQIMWNGKDNANNSVSSGVYFYKLSINGKSEPSRKCLLLK